MLYPCGKRVETKSQKVCRCYRGKTGKKGFFSLPHPTLIGVNGLVTNVTLKKDTKVKNKVSNTSKLITKWNFDANKNAGLNREKLDKHISSSERETIFYKAYKTLVIEDCTTN